MELQILKKKKKKRKSRIILYSDYHFLKEEEMMESIEKIKSKLKKIFKYHIGEANAINPYDLFEAVLGVSPESVDFFKRAYWWGIIKQILKIMKVEGDIFVINKISKLFVLQNKSELIDFERKINTTIENLNDAKMRAREWVRKERWKLI